MAKIFSLMSRLYDEVKKNGVSNTYYKVKEKQAKNEPDAVFSLQNGDSHAKITTRTTVHISLLT